MKIGFSHTVMMFKSKVSTTYPKVPNPPTWDDMMEDLKLALDSDILFHASDSIKSDNDIGIDQHSGVKGLKNDSAVSSLGNNDAKQTSNSDIVDTAINFAQSFDKLGISVQDLNLAGEKLGFICQNLSESVEKVKKQARTTISTKS